MKVYLEIAIIKMKMTKLTMKVLFKTKLIIKYNSFRVKPIKK